jgi:hypothetical protein
MAAALLAVSLLTPSLAGSALYKPPRGKIWGGVSDRGNVSDFRRFQNAINQHPAIMETFHPWGNKPGPADQRWTTTRTRPMLHISTAEGGGPERISPRQIVRGQGDDYLIVLNRYFGGKSKRIGYVRPFGEMNGYHNPYCAFSASGNPRSGHSTSTFKQAWRRIYIIVKGGGTRRQINNRLRSHNMPGVRHQSEPLPSYFGKAPVAFVWTPQLRSEPNVKGNAASKYWPGKQWVDWIGTDIYSNSASFRLLNSFWNRWHNKTHRPFTLAEYAVALRDNPEFIKSLFKWTRSHAKMIVYYQGYSDSDPYSPYKYPNSLRVTGRLWRNGPYPSFTPENR